MRAAWTASFVISCLLAVVLNAVPLAADAPSLPAESPSFVTEGVSSLGGSPIGSYAFKISDQSVNAVYPTVAYNSVRQEYLVVWYNDRPGNDDIQAQRLSRTGAKVGGAFYISGGAGAERRHPDVAYNSRNNEYLVVWTHEDTASMTQPTTIRARRVSGTGQVIGAEFDVQPASSLSTPADPAVAYAYTSNRYLVVWSEVFHPTVAQSIMGQVVTPAGARDGNSFVISQGSEVRSSPDLAYNISRNEYLVAWEQKPPGTITDLYARRVTGNGQALQPPSIQLAYYTVDSTSPKVAALPGGAYSGSYLVVWELHNTATVSRVYGRTVRGDGSAESDFIIAWDTDEQAPAVAGSPQSGEFLVAWKRPTNPPLVFDYVTGTTVARDGSSVGMFRGLGGALVANAEVVAGFNGDYLVVFDDLTPGASSRDVYGRLWGNRIYLPLSMRNLR